MRTPIPPVCCSACGKIFTRSYRIDVARARKRQFCSRECQTSARLADAESNILVRFENKFLPEPMSGCWLWMATIQPETGYGAISRPGGVVGAHRLSWELYRGAIPDGLHVLHKCDIRSCVNPDHLFLGTNKDNVDDMLRKGRSRKKPLRSETQSMMREEPFSTERKAQEFLEALEAQGQLALESQRPLSPPRRFPIPIIDHPPKQEPSILGSFIDSLLNLGGRKS